MASRSAVAARWLGYTLVVAAAAACVVAGSIAGPYLALEVQAWLWCVFAAAATGDIP